MVSGSARAHRLHAAGATCCCLRNLLTARAPAQPTPSLCTPCHPPRSEKKAEAKRKGRKLGSDESDSDYDEPADGSGAWDGLAKGSCRLLPWAALLPCEALLPLLPFGDAQAPPEPGSSPQQPQPLYPAASPSCLPCRLPPSSPHCPLPPTHSLPAGSDEDVPAGVADDPFFQQEDDPFDDPFFKASPAVLRCCGVRWRGRGRRKRLLGFTVSQAGLMCTARASDAI